MSTDILASLGIQPALDSLPTVDACSTEITQGTTYPTGVVLSLSITAVFPWLMLGFLIFKFSRIIAQFLLDGYWAQMSQSTDLEFRLTYECWNNGTRMSSVTVTTAVEPDQLVLEEVSAPAEAITADDELREVVIE